MCISSAAIKTNAANPRNANGPFINSNGNPVPKAGTFYNGAKINQGPSDLALDQTFLVHTIVLFPWKIEASGIFRAQSGFHFGVSPTNGGPDFDGDGLFNGAGLNFDGHQLGRRGMKFGRIGSCELVLRGAVV